MDIITKQLYRNPDVKFCLYLSIMRKPEATGDDGKLPEASGGKNFKRNQIQKDTHAHLGNTG